MKHAGNVHARRLMAVLLTLAMVLSTFSVPALAQEDWQMLLITLSWVDTEGNPQTALAAPVTWSQDQSFWAQVDASAPLDGLTITISHPNHTYVFDPADGSVLPLVVDSGSTMDALNVIPITAKENGNVVDTFNLYISTTMPQPEESPAAPVQTTVQVIYQTEDGQVLDTQNVTCMSNQENPVTASSGATGDYTLVGDATVNVTVNSDGTASPNPVVFTYKAPEKQPAQVDVQVIYQTEDGQVLDTQSVTCYENQENPVTASSGATGDYTLVGDATVNVTVNSDGTASPNPVVFTYKAPEKQPAQVDVQVIYQTEDGQVLDTQSVTCYENQENPVTASSAATGDYTLTGDATVNVTVNSDGTASPNPVIFTYKAPEKQPAQADVQVIYQTEDGQVLDTQSVTCYENQENIIKPSSAMTGGYELTSVDSVPVTVDANGVATPAPVTFVYRPVSTEPSTVAVEVYYQDEEGHDVADFQTLQLTENDQVVTASPVNLAAGYSLISEASVPITIKDGKADPETVTFYYRLVSNEPAKTATVTVAYQDEKDGTPVAESQEVTLYEGTWPVTANPSNLKEGYTLSGAASQDVTVDNTGKASADTVTFTYAAAQTEAKSATVIISYQNEDHEDIAGPFTQDLEGGKSTVVAPDAASLPEGYDITSAQPVAVNVSTDGVADPASVTFTFKKTVVETPIPEGELIQRFGVTNAKQVHWRDKPSTTGKDLGTFTKGTYVWLIQANQNDAGESWTRILVNGVEGYVMSKFVDVLTQAESDAYQQAELETPVPTLVPGETLAPATEQPATEAPATEAPATEAPATEAPVTEAPVTEAPVTEAPATQVPEAYTGYALTTEAVALRTEISTADSSIIVRLEKDTLLSISGQSYAKDTGASWSTGTTLDNVTGMVPDSSLRRITAEEAKYYIDKYTQEHATPTPSPAPVTAAPAQQQGYAVTVGDDVYFRNMPSTMSDIKDVLARGIVVYVNGQQYVDTVAWHIVQYNNTWGYIRADLLRMLTPAEENAYLQSLKTPAPTLVTTPQPYDQNSLSSYGYVTSSTVNFRKSASTSSSKLKTLKQYAFCLVLGTTEVNGSTWYRVNYGGSIGYIQGDYFKQLTMTELTDFLTSNEYKQGITNNATSNTVTNNTTGSGSSGIVSAEDQTVNTWTNPNSGVNVSYEPFDPFATIAPLATGSVSPSAEASETPAATTLEPIATIDVTSPVEETQTDGGSAVGWIIAVLILLLCGGGGAYAYVLHKQNQRKAAQRAAQRRAAAQRTADGRPYARTGNPQNPAQPRTGTYANPAGGTPRPTGQAAPQARRPYTPGQQPAPGQNGYGQRPASGAANGYGAPYRPATGSTPAGTVPTGTAPSTGAAAPRTDYTASYRPSSTTPTAERPASYRPGSTTPTDAPATSTTPAGSYTASYRPGSTAPTDAPATGTTPAGSYTASYRSGSTAPTDASATGTTPVGSYTASYRSGDAQTPGRRSAYRATQNQSPATGTPAKPASANDDFADDKDQGDF